MAQVKFSDISGRLNSSQIASADRILILDVSDTNPVTAVKAVEAQELREYAAGVTTFNGRSGAITLIDSDIPASIARDSEVATKENAGTASSLIATHEGATDPHPQYATDAALSSHAGASDPHPQYALLVGAIIRSAHFRSTTTATTTNSTFTTTPYSVTITPTSATSLLRVTFSANVGISTTAIFADIALFRDGVNTISSSSLAYTRVTQTGGASSAPRTTFVDYFTAGSTTATTFSIQFRRSGGVGTDSVKIGGRLSDALLDAPITMFVEEVKQ